MYLRIVSLLAIGALVAKVHAAAIVDTAAETPVVPEGVTAESMAQVILEKQQAAVEEALKAAAAKSRRSGSFMEEDGESLASEADSGYQFSNSVDGSGASWQDLSDQSDFGWSGLSGESEL